MRYKGSATPPLPKSKPVITCTDSGGPLEFVVHRESGLVVAPDPRSIAEAIDELYAHRARAAEMGRAGRDRYDALGISWDKVVQTLVPPFAINTDAGAAMNRASVALAHKP